MNTVPAIVSRTAAVALSPVRPQREMFPAPTRVTTLEAAVTASVPEPAAPYLSVTVMLTVWGPLAL